MTEAEAVAKKVYERVSALNDALGEAAQVGVQVNFNLYDGQTLGDKASRTIMNATCHLLIEDKR